MKPNIITLENLFLLVVPLTILVVLWLALWGVF